MIHYKLCPICETNYIKENEEMCEVCNPKKSIAKQKKAVEADFSSIKLGCVYGSNSREIYERFCKTLNWDKSKSDQFGRQGVPLYAENVDNKKNDVWFITYYVNKETDYSQNSDHKNVILNDGNEIIEIVSSRIGKSNEANRITFIKTSKGYAFLGVYELIENGLKRKYKRISSEYSITRFSK